MPTVAWVDGFNTGHQAIDSDHREFIDSITELETELARREFPAANARCARLRERLWRHFAYEEIVLRYAGFPRIETHVESHARSRRKIENMLGRCGEVCSNGARVGCVSLWLDTLLEDVLLPDLDFKAHLENRQKIRS